MTVSQSRLGAGRAVILYQSDCVASVSLLYPLDPLVLSGSLSPCLLSCTSGTAWHFCYLLGRQIHLELGPSLPYPRIQAPEA